MLTRRGFLASGLAAVWARPLLAAVQQGKWDAAAKVLSDATDSGLVQSASLYIRHQQSELSRAFGQASSPRAMFLLGSISKPICVTALMPLIDKKLVRLDDPVQKYLPKFKGDGREQVTIRHVLSHVSGLPDQLENNNELRAKHAPLAAFVDGAQRAPLAFDPGSRYQYSSMGILLATHIAELLTDRSIHDLVMDTVCKPLELKRTVLGVGDFPRTDLVDCQTDRAAPESGAGDPAAKDWDWNSDYWRKLGAPWGGVHASAADVARYLAAFAQPDGRLMKPETAREMVRNQNPPGFAPRGLGLQVGASLAGGERSERTFGHTGSTGTIAWLDPVSDLTCVVLTSLPARAVPEHPRTAASQLVAESV